MAPSRRGRPLTVCAGVAGGVTALSPWLIGEVDGAGGMAFLLGLSALLVLPFAILVRAHTGWNRIVAWTTLAVMVALVAITFAPSTLESSSTAGVGIVFLPFLLGAVVLAAYTVNAICVGWSGVRERRG